MKTLRNLFLFSFILLSLIEASSAMAANPQVYLFGRSNCEFCAAERTFLDNAGVTYTYYDVVPGTDASSTFDLLAQQHNFKNITPVTVIGAEVFQGFDGATTTGAQLLSALQTQADSPYDTLQKHIATAPHTAAIAAGSGCDANGVTCSIENMNAHIISLPLYGLVDASFFSPFALSPVLGLLAGASTGLLWFLLFLLTVLFMASERQIFERRLGLVLVVEVATVVYLLAVPDGLVPVAALMGRIQLAVVMVGGLLGLAAAIRLRRLVVGDTIEFVINLLAVTALALIALVLPLATYLAQNAYTHTFIFVVQSTVIGLPAQVGVSLLFIAGFLLCQLAAVGLAVVLWHRYVLHRSERERYFALVSLIVLLLTCAILGIGLLG